MKRFMLFVTAFIILFSFTAFAGGGGSEWENTETEDSVPTVGSLAALNCASAILIDAKTGEPLYEQTADERRSPASITKIMTLIIIMEELEKGNLKLTDTVTASTAASQMGGSQIYLREHEQMTVHELLKAITVVSANDAAFAMAEHIAGSEEAFVSRMNETAKRLKMENTHFVNCTGLDAEGHLTTARDIAIMSSELLKYDLIREYTTIWTDSLRDGKYSLVNTNRLIRFYDGATGLKTGSTDLAGSCISASAMRDGTELIAVILGAKSGDERFEEAKKLLNYGFANYKRVALDVASGPLEVTVKKGVTKLVTGKVTGSHELLLEKEKIPLIKREIVLFEALEAPVLQNQTVGEMVFSIDGEVIAKIPITAEKEVKKAGLFFYFAVIWKVISG